VTQGVGGDIARVAAWPDELRFGITIALMIALFAAAARLARRIAASSNPQARPQLGDWLADAILLALLAQYVVVGVAGLLGILGPGSITIGSAVSAAALWQAAGRFPPLTSPLQFGAALRDPIPWSLCLVLAELAAIVWVFLRAPVTANDALTYHLPAAVSWLQSGRITPFDVWFYNPANTYSPLAGSLWAAWYLGPAGGDVVARFVEIPGLILLWAAAVSLGLSIVGDGTEPGPIQRGYTPESRVRWGRWTVALLAVAVVTARPFISQANLAKDDAYTTGLFIAIVAALASRRMNDRLGPWRLGTAIGLFFATKFTALISLPVLLVAADVLWRSRWPARKWMIATAVALILAAPWFLRNALLTGNPLYPMDVNLLGHRVLTGLFAALPSTGLRNYQGLHTALIGGYYCVSPLLAGLLVLSWLLACLKIFFHKKAGLGQSDSWLARLLLLGPPIGIALFIWKSPFAESRFVGPEIALLFIAPALLCRLWPATALFVAAVVAVMAILGGFAPHVLLTLAPYALVAAIILIALRVALVAWPPPNSSTSRIAWSSATVALALVIAATVYAQWPIFAQRRLADEDLIYAQPQLYPAIAGAWEFVRDHTEPHAIIAYANFYYTYPLFGPHLSHRVVYAPTRPGIHHLYDLPHFNHPLTGEAIYDAMVQILQSEPNEQVWRANLRASGAEYLVVSMRKVNAEQHPATPPEAVFADNDPASFQKIYDDGAARVYLLTGLGDSR
jgi:hypothetical protein